MNNVIPKWMFNRIKEKFEVSNMEDIHKLTDEQLLSVPMFGKMRLQRLRDKQEKTVDLYSYNKGVHDAVVGICRLITDNYKKCITRRECEILMHEDVFKMKENPVLKSLEKLVAHHDPDGDTFLIEHIEEAKEVIFQAKELLNQKPITK